MPEDRAWWDYRFPHRLEHPDHHRKFLRLLVETWISPRFEDWVVLLAAGSATRLDADAARAVEHARAAGEGHERYLGAAEQIHLQALGTRPSLARRGLARGLVRWGTERAVREGVVATVLAAPMARAVYPRFGFQELGMVTAHIGGVGGYDVSVAYGVGPRRGAAEDVRWDGSRRREQGELVTSTSAEQRKYLLRGHLNLL